MRHLGTTRTATLPKKPAKSFRKGSGSTHIILLNNLTK
jgi:hypothetical protein